MSKRGVECWLRGLAKSLTIYAGTLVLILGYMQDQKDIINQYIGKEHSGLVFMGIGLLIIMLRARTSKSLTEKGRPKE